MLFLQISVGSERFAVEADRVVEIVPLVLWKRVPEAPPGVAGLINYHGAVLPLVDLSLLVLGREALARVGTRIVVIGADDTNAAFGVIVERVTAPVRLDPREFVAPPDVAVIVPWLGGVRADDQGVVQHLIVDELMVPGALLAAITTPAA